MKIRTGFVSNSSSSSFVLLLPKNEWDGLVKNMTPEEKVVVAYSKKEKQIQNDKFCGIDVVEFSGITGNYSCFDGGEDDKIVYEILNKAKKCKDARLTYTEC